MRTYSNSRAVWIALIVSTLSACALNPFQAAETPAQRGYALEASYNIVLEDALAIASAPTTSASVRQAIKDAELKSTPTIVSLSDALAAYEVERAKFEIGQTTAERVEIVANNLATWVEEAKKALVALQLSFRN